MTNQSDFEIEETVTDSPERIIVYGAPGVGKSTFVAGAPRMIFFDLERSTIKIPHARRLSRKDNQPLLTFGHLLEGMKWLRHGRHDLLAFGYDTYDVVEGFAAKELCEREGVESIEKVGGGYGRGNTALFEKMREFEVAIADIVHSRNMSCISVAHQRAENVKNPSGYDYKRYTLNLSDKSTGLLLGAVDHVFYATRPVVVSESVFDEKRARAVATGERVLRTQEGPAHVAKSRAKLPDPIPLSWHDFVCHLANAGWPRLLRETVVDNARRLGNPETQRKVEGMVRENPDVGTLAAANKKLCDLLAASAPGAAVQSASNGAATEPKPEEGAKPAATAAVPNN
jgi:hypothetical protein